MKINATNKLEDVFIELGGKLCELIGWRRVIGQVYMLLYISDSPLSLSQLMKRIGMSKSTVWAAISKLQRLNAVNIAESIGKKCYYTAERDFEVILNNGIIPELSSKLLFANSYFKQVDGMLADFQQDTKGEDESTKCRVFLNEFARKRDKLEFLLKQLPLLIDADSI